MQEFGWSTVGCFRYRWSTIPVGVTDPWDWRHTALGKYHGNNYFIFTQDDHDVNSWYTVTFNTNIPGICSILDDISQRSCTWECRSPNQFQRTLNGLYLCNDQWSPCRAAQFLENLHPASGCVDDVLRVHGAELFLTVFCLPVYFFPLFCYYCECVQVNVVLISTPEQSSLRRGC